MSTYRPFKIAIPCAVIDPDFKQTVEDRKAELVLEVRAHSPQDALDSFTRYIQEFIKEKENG